MGEFVDSEVRRDISRQWFQKVADLFSISQKIEFIEDVKKVPFILFSWTLKKLSFKYIEFML